MNLSHHEGLDDQAIQTQEIEQHNNHINNEAGKSRLPTVVAVGACAAILCGTVLFLKEQASDVFSAFRHAKDKVAPKGVTTVTPQETKMSIDLRKEQVSLPINIKESNVKFKISGRGLFGVGANVSCDLPYKGVSHGYLEEHLQGTVRGDHGKFSVPQGFKYDKPFVEIVPPSNGKSVQGKYCDEGALGILVQNLGGSPTNPAPKAKEALQKELGKRLSPSYPYSAYGNDKVLQCFVAGTASHEASVYNPALKKIDVTLQGQEGIYNEQRCVEMGTVAEKDAFNGKPKPIDITVSGIEVSNKS